MTKSTRKEIRFEATRSSEKVSGVLIRPTDARWLLLFGHGAGAGMYHRWMEAMSGRLADEGIATFRYQFPYAERGMGRPDPKPVLLTTVRSACEAARKLAGDLPLLVGGKSMGGRMTSMAVAEQYVEGIRGIVFFGFPLHPAGAPSVERAEHLSRVGVPMLFLQGTRDGLADLILLKPVCKHLGKWSTLHIIEGADHSFHVPKKSGRTDGEVMDEMCAVVRSWAESLQ